MKTLFAMVMALAIMLPSLAEAGGTNCTTRKSGSVTITSCSNAYRAGGFSTCRSYRSGSVIKTSCR